MTGDRSRHAPQKQHGDAVYGDGGNRTHAVFPPLLPTIVGILSAVALSLPVAADARCRTHKCWHRVSVKRHVQFWPKRFHAQPQAWQDWAHRVSWCESNDRRIARESGFWSYFQWTLPTWHTVGGSGNPETHSYAEQALRAIRLARSDGTQNWPVCGR